jgi:hypothetical protein
MGAGKYHVGPDLGPFQLDSGVKVWNSARATFYCNDENGWACVSMLSDGAHTSYVCAGTDGGWAFTGGRGGWTDAPDFSPVVHNPNPPNARSHYISAFYRQSCEVGPC